MDWTLGMYDGVREKERGSLDEVRFLLEMGAFISCTWLYVHTLLCFFHEVADHFLFGLFTRQVLRAFEQFRS